MAKPQEDVYFVTTVHLDNMGEIVRKRCIGWYPQWVQAKMAVENNYGDMYENGHYNYVVVERLGPGIYPMHQWKFEVWYQWHRRGERYIETRKPKRLERTVNFAIG